MRQDKGSGSGRGPGRKKSDAPERDLALAPSPIVPSACSTLDRDSGAVVRAHL